MRPLAVAVVAFGCAASMRLMLLDQQHADRQTRQIDEDVLSSPGPAVLNIVALEHPHGWSDLVWLTLVQELGRGDQTTRAAWDRVWRWADIATDLDAKYFSVYYASAVQLSAYGRLTKESDYIAEKGYRHLNDKFALPMLVGYNAYFLRGDAERASDFFLEASRVKGAPNFLAALAGRVRFHAGDERGAIALLEIFVEQTVGPQREDALFRLKSLRSEQRLDLFDVACQQFVERTGAHPTTGEQLVQAGLLDAPPFDEHESPITFDGQSCEALTKKIKIRERTARDRMGSHLKKTVEP